MDNFIVLKKEEVIGGGRDIDPARVVTSLKERVHPAAAGEIGGIVFDRVVEWVRTRLEVLQLGNNDLIGLTVNRWDIIASLGLQSVSLKARRLQGDFNFGVWQSILKSGEWKDPMIGLIAKDIIAGDDVHWDDVTFSVDDKEAERTGQHKVEVLNALSPGLLLERVPPRHKSAIGVEVFEQLPADLKINNPLRIKGPDRVRTILQVKNKQKTPRRRYTHDPHYGVYACQFELADALNG